MKKIPLSGKHGRGKFVIVDDEDFEELSKTSWSYHKGYAYGRPNKCRNKLQMHRVIMKLTSPKILCDHINSNPLDNRKKNLRTVTHKENSWNSSKHSNSKTSKYKGVSFFKPTQKYKAQIRIGDSIRILIGYFEKEIDAAAAYNIFARKHHGEYAKLNKIPIEVERSVKIPKKRIKTSQYKGVHFSKAHELWIVQITVESKKQKEVGRFKTELEAVKAYNREAKKFGKPLNKIQKGQK